MYYEIDLNNQADYQKSSGNGLNLALGDSVLLSSGATISATVGAGIYGISSTSLLLNGKVKSNTGNALHLLGGLHLISVGNGAELTGATGIFAGQGGNDIKNYGSVTGTATYGIYAAGSNNTITNEGILWGKTYGLVVGSAEAFGNYIENTGTIEGQDTGVVLKGSATLTTSGLVKGTTGYAIDSPSAEGDVVSIINEAVITGGGGTAILGGSGSESIANYGQINGSVSLGDGNDTYDGKAGFVTGIVDLGGGNDKASGGVGSETLNGGAGSDTLSGGLGNDSLVGGSGIDTAVFAAAGGVTANLSTGQATGEGEDTLSGIENLTGGSGADTFTGDSNANLLIGKGGNDVLSGGAHHDTLDGGLGDDTLTGGTGNDLYIIDSAGDKVIENTDVGGGWDTVRITGTFVLSDTVGVEVLQASVSAATGAWMVGNNLANTLIGASGDDTLDGGAGLANDSFDGGSGTDTVVFSGAAGATVNLNTAHGQATGYGTDTFKNIENLTGGTGADNFTGDNAANVLTGNGGNDTLSGADGNDTLYGGAGSDSLLGGFGNDRLDGGTGSDTMAGGAGDDTYIIDSAGDQIIELMDGGNGFDTALIFTNSYTVGSGVSLEVLQVDASVTSGATILDNIASSTIIGASGNDALHGSDGDDYLIGGAGNDSLYGGVGKDTLEGGAGNDYFHSTAGGDTVIYNGSQAVTANLAVLTAQNVGTGYGFDTFANESIWHLITGSGNDSLTGNSAWNILMGNGGTTR
jgi:Ca2+-binding RTX toxin-like protein